MSGQREAEPGVEDGREPQPTYPEKDERYRSRQITAGPGRAPQRAMFRAMGFDDEDLASPMVGVANPAADLTPCNVHLDGVADAATAGVDEAGGMPVGFGTITISDAISVGTEGMKTSLISRELIADSVELVNIGELRSSSSYPIARNMARWGARPAPAVIWRLRYRSSFSG